MVLQQDKILEPLWLANITAKQAIMIPRDYKIGNALKEDPETKQPLDTRGKLGLYGDSIRNVMPKNLIF